MGLRRRVWWLLVAMAVLIVLFGVGDVLIGAAADPAIAQGLSGLSLAELEAQSAAAYGLFDFFTRTQGLVLVAFGVAMTSILLIPYRQGREWAWWTAWLLPAWSLSVLAMYAVGGVAPDQPPPPPMLSGPLLALIAAAVLLLDRHRFVAAEAMTPTEPRFGAGR